MTQIDPDDFAEQINYLAALGRMIVPRAFSFVSCRILFVGYLPFHPEELGSLLPEEVEWYEHEDSIEHFAPDVIIIGREFEKGAIRSAMGSLKHPPKVIPQEGFLDELLFGHDWWSGEVGLLTAMVNHHRGLQSARDAGFLSSIGLPKPQPKKTAPTAKPAAVTSNLPSYLRVSPTVKKNSVKPQFVWPDTNAKETQNPSNIELDLQPQSKLNQLGYSTNLSRSERWRILEVAVPKLGLHKVAGHIAWLCRWRKKQQDGKRKFAGAIAEWEYDLARLKREYYQKRSNFPWPHTSD